MTATNQKEIYIDITGIQERIDKQIDNATMKMRVASSDLGNAVWANILGGTFLWNTFRPSEIMLKMTEDNTSKWLYAATFIIGAGATFFGINSLGEGVGHLQIRKGILKEIQSLRSVLVGKYNAAINGNQP